LAYLIDPSARLLIFVRVKKKIYPLKVDTYFRHAKKIDIVVVQ